MVAYSDAEVREQNRRRQANSRARRAGKPEPYPKQTAEEKETVERIILARGEQHEIDLAFATSQDAIGRYRSEVLSCVKLLGVYEGNHLTQEEDTDDEDQSRKKKKEKTDNRLNPSQYKITIRAVEFNGLLLEPNCSSEFKQLKEVDEVVSFRRWLDLRDKARKDLFWLGRLLGKGLFHSFHQYFCDQFVKKNFGGPGLDGVDVPPMYFEDYDLDAFHDMLRKQVRTVSDTDLTPCSEMVLLEPRGAYKSTINNIDSVQWLINAPDIRIMVITGIKGLARKFIREIKGYFYLKKKAVPTAFQLLFPEYVITGVDGASEQPLDCPAAHLTQKESNLWTTSIESSNTGDHCDIRKADDVVTSKNSLTEELRENLKFEFDGTDDNLDQWGFSDVMGTRYFTDDWYGTRMLPNPDTGEVAPYRYSCRGSWILSPEHLLDYRSGKLTLKDIITNELGTLTFPYKLSWKHLRKTFNKKGERGFKNQQLNEATDAKDLLDYVNHFTELALQNHSYPAASAPRVGQIYNVWDWALSAKKTSDYSVGASVLVYRNQKNQTAVCVMEIVYGKWRDSELVLQILSLYKRTHPERIVIENSNAADMLKTALQNESYRRSVPEIMNQGLIYWKPVDTTKNAKANRIKSLELLLSDDRLHFVNGAWLDETFKQLTQYTGAKSTSYRKDDIPDALSFIIDLLPRDAVLNSAVDPKQAERIAEEQQRLATQAAWRQRMYGMSSQPISTAPTQPEPQPDPRRAAMTKLFGGNGLRA